MKRILFAIPAAVVLCFMITGCCGNSQKKTACATVPADRYVWDFGTVKSGQVLTHEFDLRNETPDILNIKEISTSCGCTVSKARKETLLPGETTIIEVKFNSEGYFGLTQQYIYVNTDSLDNPVIRFIIKADVAK